MSKSEQYNQLLGQMSHDMYFRGQIARFHGCTELDSDEKIFAAEARRNFEVTQLREENERLREQVSA